MKHNEAVQLVHVDIRIIVIGQCKTLAIIFTVGNRVTISASTIQTLDDAIQAHQAWKTRFKVAILKQETLDDDEIGRDDCCALGQWIFAEGSDRYGASPLFTRLVEKHSDFHLEAGHIAKQINARQNDMAIRGLSPASRFTAASTEVIALVQELKASL